MNGLRVAAMIPDGGAMYFLTDQVDSVKVVVNDAGKAVTRYEYKPYGEAWFTEGDEDFAPKYNSQELDKETNFYFYNARYYDPEICRFVTADNQIDNEGDTQGWNRYSYVKGNPIVYKDPTGHKTVIEGTETEINKLAQGLESATGTSLELKLTQIDKRKGLYSAEITKFKTTNNRFKEEQGKLKELIDDKSTTKIVFDNKGKGGTGFQGATYDDKDQTVYIDPEFKKNKQNNFVYQSDVPSETKKGNIINRISSSIANRLLGKDDDTKTELVNRTLPSTLAHELLGHGIDKIKGKLKYDSSSKDEVKKNSEGRAIGVENKVHSKLNEPLRSR